MAEDERQEVRNSEALNEPELINGNDRNGKPSSTVRFHMRTPQPPRTVNRILKLGFLGILFIYPTVQLWAGSQLEQLLHYAHAYRCVWKRYRRSVSGVLFDAHYPFVIGHSQNYTPKLSRQLSPIARYSVSLFFQVYYYAILPESTL